MASSYWIPPDIEREAVAEQAELRRQHGRGLTPRQSERAAELIAQNPNLSARSLLRFTHPCFLCGDDGEFEVEGVTYSCGCGGAA